MATNVDKKIDAKVDTEGRGTTPPTDKQNDTSHTGSGQNGISRRTWLLDLNRLLLHLACLVYSLYLIWLLAYLKDNKYYWFLSFIPFFFNFCPLLLLYIAYRHPHHGDIEKWFNPSYGLVVNLMACFTMLTRQAYYHRQPDQFIGPRFIIISMQGSIVFILLDFVLQRVGKQDGVLDYKDALTRMLLDFVDIFNMVEILSVNVCVGVGWHVSEDSSTEMAIQAFCTMSFLIVLLFSQYSIMIDEEEQHSPKTRGEILYSKLTICSGLYQNVPFLIIRICVWAQYKLYNLGFLVKNVTVIIFFIAVLFQKLLIACVADGCIKL